jgi:hypothetical protein
LCGRQVLTHLGIRHELDALLGHEIDTTLNDFLVELHVGDAVHQQPADSIGPLEDSHPIARLVKLIRARQPPIEPLDMAPVSNYRQIVSIGSTSWMGTGWGATNSGRPFGQRTS